MNRLADIAEALIPLVQDAEDEWIAADAPALRKLGPTADELCDLIERTNTPEGILDPGHELIMQGAWQVLAATPTRRAVDTMIGLMLAPREYYEDALHDDFESWMEQAGSLAVEPLQEAIHRREPDQNSAAFFIRALVATVADESQETQVATILTEELARLLPTHFANAQIVDCLVGLGAADSLPTIHKALEADVVNLGISGTKRDIEQALGIASDSPAEDEDDFLYDRYIYAERRAALGELGDTASPIETADHYLRLYHQPGAAEDASDLEGLLAASLIMEHMVPLGDLLATAWGGDLPLWAESTHESAFLDAMLAMQKSVAEQMTAGAYVPLGRPRDGAPTAIYETLEEQLSATSYNSWVFGLLRGLNTFLDEPTRGNAPWKELLELATYLMIFEIRLETVDDADSHPVLQVIQELMTIRAAAQAGGLAALARTSRANSGPIRAEKTPGRNEPCPCGSGRKFKKCCAE